MFVVPFEEEAGGLVVVWAGVVAIENESSGCGQQRPRRSRATTGRTGPVCCTMTSLQVRLERPEWQPILHSSTQVVLYNPTSHALIIHPSSQSANRTVTVDQSVPHICPYCSRPLPPGSPDRDTVHEQDPPFTHLSRFEDVSEARASNYFQLLQVANESASRPPSPPLRSTPSPPSTPLGVHDDTVFTPDSMAEGYFKAFFQEEARLGMGANGTVFLCQVRSAVSTRLLNSFDDDGSMSSTAILSVNWGLLSLEEPLTHSFSY